MCTQTFFCFLLCWCHYELVLLIFTLTKLFPFEITEYRYNGIQTIKTAFERYVLVEIEYECYNVNNNPYKPLLKVFAGKCPNANKGKGCGE